MPVLDLPIPEGWKAEFISVLVVYMITVQRFHSKTYLMVSFSLLGATMHMGPPISLPIFVVVTASASAWSTVH